MGRAMEDNKTILTDELRDNFGAAGSSTTIVSTISSITSSISSNDSVEFVIVELVPVEFNSACTEIIDETMIICTIMKTRMKIFMVLFIL